MEIQESKRLAMKHQDRISELPDLVLSCILSNLSLRDLIKASALSKRWKLQHRKLLSIDKLDFDLSNLFGSKYDEQNVSSKLNSNSNFLNQVSGEFINRGDEILHYFKGSKIRSFRVNFFMSFKVSSNVDSWIRSAIASGVEEIQLFFTCPFILPLDEEDRKCYEFPYWFFKQYLLKHLQLRFCLLRPPSDFTGFAKLLTLRLDLVRLGQDFMASLCNICPLLHELIITTCFFSPSPILRIVSTSLVKLALLHITVHKSVRKIEISAVNLIYFEYYNVTCYDSESDSHQLAEITLFHAPRLAKFDFFMHQHHRLPNVLSQSTSVTNLENLTAILMGNQSLASANISALRNLKQLSLFYLEPVDEKDFIWVLDILKASPLLQKLDLTFSHGLYSYGVAGKAQKQIRKLNEFTHKNLKQVEMGGCTANWREIELMLFILKNAIALERAIIHSSIKYDSGEWKWNCTDRKPNALGLNQVVIYFRGRFKIMSLQMFNL